MDNAINLQLKRHEEVFATRDAAVEYIEDYLKPDVLMAEPAVVFYGTDRERNAILAIGAGNRKVFLIDIANLQEQITNINNAVDGVDETLEEFKARVSELVSACGLDYDQNKKSNQITYIPNSRDAVIGDSSSLSEAVAALSEFMQKSIADNTLEVTDSSTVSFSYKDGAKGGKNLTAYVKVSTEGNDDDVSFNDNIIGKKSDGIFAAVNVRYDEETNRIIFTSSGTNKEGRFVTDAKKQIIQLPDAEKVVAKNSDESPVKVSVVNKDKTNKISATISLSENANNIIKITDGKLTANVTVGYNSATNELVFDNGIETKTIKLNVGGLIERAYYDRGKESIILVFRYTDGSTKDVAIPVRDILNELEVENTGKTVTLTKTIDSESGTDKLSANVNISEIEDNILESDGNSLYVRGIAKNIRYKNTNVAAALDSLKSDNDKLAQDFIQEINNQSNSIKEVTRLIEQEIKDRQHADDDIKHLIEDLDIDGLKSAIEEFKKTYSEFEKEWSAYKVQIEKAIADAESVVTRVSELEKSFESYKAANDADIAALKDRVATAEGNINTNASKIADNALAIANESTLARQNESDLKNALDKEVVRSTAKDEELANSVAANKADVESLKFVTGKLESDLSSEITRATSAEQNITDSLNTVKATAEQNKTDIANNLQSLNNEINRATLKESEIEGKLNDEVNRAAGEEKRLEALISTNKADIASNKEYIGSLSTSVSGVRNDIDTEIAKARSEEKRIEEKIDSLAVTSNAAAENALTQSKAYTDAEILKATVAAEQDAAAKANKALEDAKSYSDDKLALETARAQAAEKLNSDAIAELKAKDAEIEANVAKKVENVRVEKSSASDLLYTLYVDDKVAGEINIPKDQFLKGVRYDAGSKSLVFTWEIEDAHPETTVDVSDFLTVYYAGNGLQLENNTFSVKLTTANESYLQLTSDGLQLVGIDAKFDTKADKESVYSKLEVDNLVESEAIRAKGIEEGLQSAIDNAKADTAALTERVAANEAALVIVNGNEAQEGSIQKALADAKSYAYEIVSAEITRATDAEKAAENNAKEYTDELGVRVATNEEAIKKLNGNFAEEGSVANAIYQSKNYTDEKIAEVNAAVGEKANSADVYTKSEIDSKGFLTSSDIEDLATKDSLEEETNRAKAAEQANAEAIGAVKSTAEGNTVEINNLKASVASLEPSVEDSDSVRMFMNKGTSGTSFKSEVKLDLEKQNILKISGNGLYAEVTLEYNTAENKLTFTAGGVSKDIQLAGANIIEEGYYDSKNRKIVLIINGGKNIEVPVSDLFNQLIAINPDNDPVNLTIEHNSEGQDTIQANLNISTSADNLILNSNGTLFASKRAIEHVMKLDGIGDDIDVQSAVNMVKKTADGAAQGVEDLKSRVTNLEGDVSDLKVQVNNNSTAISNLENRMTNAETNIETNSTNIQNLQSRVETLETTVNNHETRLGDIETNITNMKTDITNIQQSITNIENILNGTGEGGSVIERLEKIEDALGKLIDFGFYN